MVIVTEVITQRKKSFNTLNDAALNYGINPSGFYKKLSCINNGNAGEFLYFMRRLIPLKVKVVN